MVIRASDAGPPAREIEHTADVGFEVEAPTLPLLFERAGLAVLRVMADLSAVEPRTRTAIACEGADAEELLHDWLQALIVRVQADAFLVCELEVTRLDATRLRAEIAGERIDPARHGLYTEVKGVTWHQLAVERRDDGWWARVILDV
jgi:SHS2 domain-containing protein